MTYIDSFLNKTTMYRLVLYYLIGLLLVAFIFSLFGVLSLNPFYLILSVGTLLAISLIANNIFAKIIGAIPNVESVYITALILSLIVAPMKSPADFWFIFWVAIWSMASKYIFALKRKHLFNPVALAVAITAMTLNQSANWWIGTASMLPFVLVGGILVVRKIHRFDLVFYFFIAAFATTLGFSLAKGVNLVTTAQRLVLDAPLFFLAFAMLTEPLTTPPTNKMQSWYGALVGFLFAPQIHMGSFYFTPEIALLVGNVFSYAVSSKVKLLIPLIWKEKLSPDIYDFVFKIDGPLRFLPGQYLEWTLPAEQSDNRGNRRYFTIASSPTEETLRVGVKFYDKSSSFKTTMQKMKPGDQIVAGHLAGDFVLTNDSNQKLFFIAGGIGITPFRSMIKYLSDQNQRRDIVLLYSNKEVSEVVYTDVFEEAKAKIGLKTVYALTDTDLIPTGWPGVSGRIDEKIIVNEVPDYRERLLYISGPRAMVVAFQQELSKMGVRSDKIITDYFPGFA